MWEEEAAGTTLWAPGGNAVRGREMVPLHMNVFPSNEGVLFCQVPPPPPTEHLFGKETIHYFGDMDDQ